MFREIWLWSGAEKLVEWDQNTKEVIWSWSVFDYYNMRNIEADTGMRDSIAGSKEADSTSQPGSEEK